MEYYGKEKRWYHGVWIGFVAAIAFPAILFAVFYVVSSIYETINRFYAFYIALAFSGLAGFIFAITCIMTGFTHDLFVSMIDRIRDTREFYGFFTKDGLKYYLHEFVYCGGPILWLFLLITASFAVCSIIGFANFFQFYQFL